MVLAAPAAAQEREPLPAGAIARLGSLRLGPPAPHFALRFTPDGKHLVYGCEPLIVCDWATGKELRRISVVDRGFIRRFDVSPDGTLLCTVGSDHLVKLWDLATGKLLWQANAPAEHLAETVIFSPDSKHVVSGCCNQTLRWWDVQTAKETRMLRTGGQEVSDLAFSEDGKTLVSAGRTSEGRGKSLCAWDVASGQQRWLLGHTKDQWDEGGVLSINISRDGKLAASAGADGTARVWDLATAKEVHRFDLKDGVARAVAFDKDAKRLVTLGNTSGRIWDVATGKELQKLAGPPSHFGCAAFTPDGTVLATGGQAIRLFDPATGKELHTRPGHRDEVAAVAALPTGELLTAGHDHTVRCWNAHTGKELATIATLPEVVSRLAATPDGKRLATGEHKGAVRLWDVRAGTELQQFLGLAEAVVSLTFLADGTRLAAGDRDTLCVWETDTGKIVRRIHLTGKHSWSNGWAVTPDGKVAARVSNSATIQLYDLTTGLALPSLQGPSSQISAVAFSPDGTRLATADWSNNLVLWDWAAGKKLWQVKAHTGIITGLQFAPDGYTLGSSSYDQTAAVWETATGKLRVQLGKHEDIALCLAFLDGGRTLASAGRDCTALVWDVTGRQQPGGLKAAKLTAKDLGALWADLLGTDGEKAHRALWALASAPGEALPYLQKQLLTPALADAKRLDALLAGLDSPKEETAAAAMRELEIFGDRAAPLLRELLTGKPSDALKKRVDALLKKVDEGGLSAFRVRQLRALEAIEHVGGAEGRQVLETLAADRGDAFLTRAAEAALRRMKQPVQAVSDQ
jgi:WD40 repeat protein